jgi:hypothetical protein
MPVTGPTTGHASSRVGSDSKVKRIKWGFSEATSEKTQKKLNGWNGSLALAFYLATVDWWKMGQLWWRARRWVMWGSPTHCSSTTHHPPVIYVRSTTCHQPTCHPPATHLSTHTTHLPSTYQLTTHNKIETRIRITWRCS